MVKGTDRLTEAIAELGLTADGAAEKMQMLHLVRCESCEQLYRRDSSGLQEAYGYNALRDDKPITRRLILCGDCVNDINHRSDIAQPAWGEVASPPIADNNSSYVPNSITMWPGAMTTATVESAFGVSDWNHTSTSPN